MTNQTALSATAPPVHVPVAVPPAREFPFLQRACACGGSAGVSGKCAGCDSEEKLGAAPSLQPKLTVSAPDDPYEREADDVAERVMRMPGPAAGPLAVSPVIQREAAEPDEDDMVGGQVARMVQRDPMGPEDEEERLAQRKAAAGAGPAAPAGFAAALGSPAGGAALPPAARSFFEPRFQRDLGHVRIHDGASAAAMARGINARAFTTGPDIYFASGQYDPASSAGRRLLAHELTHVFQQGGERTLRRKAFEAMPAAEPSVRIPMDSPENPNETAAEHVAADAGGAGADAPPPPAGGAAPSDGSAELPASLAGGILRPSGGSALPVHLRAAHERRLGSRLDHVRIHQGPGAARLADALDARAFTFGADVWLGEGERVTDPHLMAHELTHVAQQAPRRPDRAEAGPGGPRLQAKKHWYYALPRFGKGYEGAGNRTHDFIFPPLGKHPPNAGLFNEVPIEEGSMKGTGATGRADIVKTSTGALWAVKFTLGNPAFQAPHTRTLHNGVAIKKSFHTGNAAPAANSGVEGAKACKAAGLTPTVGICRMDSGPADVAIADLKPKYEAEVLLGGDQVDRYVTKVDELGTKVNSFAAAKPTQIHPTGKTWSVKARKLTMDEISIPDLLADPNHKDRRVTETSLYVDGHETSIRENAVVVVEKHSTGFITYEWIPLTKVKSPVPAAGAGTPAAGVTTAATPAGTIGTAKTDLQGVKDKLKEEPEAKSVAALRRPPTAMAGARRLALKREKLEAKDNFQYATWKSSSFGPWKTKAKAATGGEGKAALKTPTAEAEQRMRDEAARQIHERVPTKTRPAPADAQGRMRELDVVQHWIDHGEIYGRLRGFFGTAYVKVVKAYDNIKAKIETKVADAKKRMGAANKGTGGIKGAVLSAIRAIAGSLLGLFIRDVANRLIAAIKKGATQLLGSFFGDEVAEVEAKLQEIEKARREFEAFIIKSIEDKFKKQLEVFDKKIREIESIAATMRDIGTLVNAVKWAYRVAQCAAPPAVGCLLGLVGSAIAEAILAAIVASCWFRREIAYPMVKVLGPVRALPGIIAKAIADGIRFLLPDAAKPLMGEIDMADMESKPDDIECDNVNEYNSLDPNQMKLVELLKNYDPDHVESLLKALEHLGLIRNPPDPNDKLESSEIDLMKELLDKYGKEQLDDLVKTMPKSPPRTDVSVGEFVKELEKALPEAVPQPVPAVDTLPTAEEIVAEGQEIAKILKKIKIKIVPNWAQMVRPKGVEGDRVKVFMLRRFGDGPLTGGYQWLTITKADADGSLTVTIHAGTRYYNRDGTYIDTSVEEASAVFKPVEPEKKGKKKGGKK